MRHIQNIYTIHAKCTICTYTYLPPIEMSKNAIGQDLGYFVLLIIKIYVNINRKLSSSFNDKSK